MGLGKWSFQEEIFSFWESATPSLPEMQMVGILESWSSLSVYILVTRELPDDSVSKSPYNSKLLNNNKAVLKDSNKDSSVFKNKFTVA